MAYQNNTNNQDKPQSVTTRGYHTSNSEAIKATALEWSFQGDMLKIIISPELPEHEQTEKRRYDYDHSWITCVSRIKCLDLFEQMKETILPAMEKKENKFVSVPVAEVNQFGFGIRFDETRGCVGYVKLIRNINPENLTSTAELEYEFRKGEVIVDYDNTTGKFGNRILNNTEMTLFVRDLECFITASSKAFNHANRVVDKTYKDSLNATIRSIGAKVGAEMPVYNMAQRSGARFGQAPLFGSNAQSAPSDTIKSLDDLNIDVE